MTITEATVMVDIEDQTGVRLPASLTSPSRVAPALFSTTATGSLAVCRLDNGQPGTNETLAETIGRAGQVSAEISGLPESGNVRVKVTASYTNDDGTTFTIDMYVTRATPRWSRPRRTSVRLINRHEGR